jgi:hypothetical protein
MSKLHERKKMTDKEETISKKDHEAMMNNVIAFMSIDAAIADAKFEAEKMGKDSERFVKPLLMAKNICQQVLMGVPAAPAPAPKKEEPKKDE